MRTDVREDTKNEKTAKKKIVKSANRTRPEIAVVRGDRSFNYSSCAPNFRPFRAYARIVYDSAKTTFYIGGKTKINVRFKETRTHTAADVRGCSLKVETRRNGDYAVLKSKSVPGFRERERARAAEGLKRRWGRRKRRRGVVSKR